MRLLTRALFSLLIVSSLLFIVASPAHAEGEFKSDYKVHYTIDKNGKTNVTQDITLTNNTPNFYADKFELKIGSTKVTDVKATDNTGELETEVKFDNNITTISVKFKQRVIGAGKTLTWHLSYASTELAAKSGQIWEISIPKLAKSQDTNTYEAKVTAPRGFGPVAFALPEPTATFQNAQGQEYTFNKDQLLSSGISMSFGEKQVFSYKLNYYLENASITSQFSQIALPPDNNFQKVVLEKIDPKPVDVDVDSDGNFLAKYKLSPKQKLSVSVEGKVEVFSKPFRKIIKGLSQPEREAYTQPQQYWEIDNAQIKEKATELKTPEKIYEFVTEYLSYSNERLTDLKIERKGALAAFNSPKDAICMEFTDLFIAIARAAKIPAREIQGYAYTQNERLRPLSLKLYEGDVLHAWPEYWDDELGWVQVDPTWGSTSGGLDYFNKLDFNHITFIQRGVTSKLPYPAGAYKQDGKLDEKTVYVSFSNDLPSPTTAAEVRIDSAKNAFALFPLKAKVSVANTGSTSIIGEKLTFSSGQLKNRSTNPVEIAILPPFADRNYTFELETNDFLANEQTSLIASYADAQVTKTISIRPFYKVILEPAFVVSVASTMFIIFAGLMLYKKTHKKVAKQHSSS